MTAREWLDHVKQRAQGAQRMPKSLIPSGYAADIATDALRLLAIVQLLAGWNCDKAQAAYRVRKAYKRTHKLTNSVPEAPHD